jgi:hypothetical protein
MHPLAKSLGSTERDLLRETEDARMAELDEDGLADLHRRIRRARNKYVGIYRREGSGKVSAKGGRGMAKQKNTRNAQRAEVFEDALARVSTLLAKAAAASAEELKASRLAAAAREGDWPGAEPAASAGGGGKPKSKARDRKPKGTGARKRKSAMQAKGARKQAKKDAR